MNRCYYDGGVHRRRRRVRVRHDIIIYFDDEKLLVDRRRYNFNVDSELIDNRLLLMFVLLSVSEYYLFPNTDHGRKSCSIASRAHRSYSRFVKKDHS